MLGAVDRQSDQEIVISQEPGPFPVEEEAVRLQGVGHGLPLAVPGLDLDGPFEKVKPHEGRLPALPADTDGPLAPGQGLPEGFFEDIVAHAMNGRPGEQGRPRSVKAIGTGQVAVRAGRLDEHGIERFPPQRAFAPHGINIVDFF